VSVLLTVTCHTKTGMDSSMCHVGTQKLLDFGAFPDFEFLLAYVNCTKGFHCDTSVDTYSVLKVHLTTSIHP
jgi:hypothetical protein